MYDASNPKYRYGYLLTWQHGLFGGSDRVGVNIGAFQPFALSQFSGAWYTGSAPIWTYNSENENFSISVRLRFGKVVRRDDTVLSFFDKPEVSVAERGGGRPNEQV